LDISEGMVLPEGGTGQGASAHDLGRAAFRRRNFGEAAAHFSQAVEREP